MSMSAGGRHEYAARITWTGNRGEGTGAYDAYARSHRISISGKPDIAGSADPAFRGDADRHNPEDLFVAALAACHMLVYLGLCARQGVRVMGYEDDARGTLVLVPGGGGSFEDITLRPVVAIADASALEPARALHDRAHELCFLARSCSAPIHVEPVVRLAYSPLAASNP
jgi:organic hydroperoxide reductase OsmC/OhrA